MYFDYFLLNSVGVLNCVSIDFYGTPRVSAIVFRLISTGFSDFPANLFRLISMDFHGWPQLYFDGFLWNSEDCVSFDFFGFQHGSAVVFRVMSMEFSGCPQLYFDCFLWNSADVLNYVSIDFYTFPQVSAAVFR